MCGVGLFYYGWAVPYPIRDMNLDGKIDWKDYDVDGDKVVDAKDIVMVARIYGSSVGDVKYNARCDFNGDGVIDDYDLNAIKYYFGQGQLSLIELMGYRLTGPRGIYLIIGLEAVVFGLALLVYAFAFAR